MPTLNVSQTQTYDFSMEIDGVAYNFTKMPGATKKEAAAKLITNLQVLIDQLSLVK